MIRHYYKTIRRLWREYWQRRGWMARINRVKNEVARERAHQIEGHGWTPEFDDCHIGRQLLYASMAFAFNCDYMWPWGKERYNGERHTERKRLIKAVALIMAEIERLDRYEGSTG